MEWKINEERNTTVLFNTVSPNLEYPGIRRHLKTFIEGTQEKERK